jgi:hypothetical protein
LKGRKTKHTDHIRNTALVQHIARLLRTGAADSVETAIEMTAARFGSPKYDQLWKLWSAHRWAYDEDLL